MNHCLLIIIQQEIFHTFFRRTNTIQNQGRNRTNMTKLNRLHKWSKNVWFYIQNVLGNWFKLYFYLYCVMRTWVLSLGTINLLFQYLVQPIYFNCNNYNNYKHYNNQHHSQNNYNINWSEKITKNEPLFQNVCLQCNALVWADVFVAS